MQKNKIMKKITSIVLAAQILVGCINSDENSEKVVAPEQSVVHLSDEELNNLNLQTDTIRLQRLYQTLHLKGYIDVPPQNICLMSVPLGGYLKYTHLLPGTAVKKGEVIAILEDPQYIQLQEDFLKTKIQLSALEKNYQRQKELSEQKAVSDKTYEQAKAEYENAKILLKSLEEKLKLINIQAETLTEEKISSKVQLYAPFTGYVTKINFSVGKYIPPSEVLFELVNPDDIHLNVKVFENDLPYIQTGQKVWAYTNQQPDKRYLCEVILINKAVNPDRTIDVHCHFQKYDERLIPGTYMQAEILTGDSLIYALPSSAVLFFNNSYYVFIQQNKNEFKMQEVKITDFKNENFIGISNYNDVMRKKIVTKGAYSLLMKMKNVGE